jgi:hypothetical protein
MITDRIEFRLRTTIDFSTIIGMDVNDDNDDDDGEDDYNITPSFETQFDVDFEDSEDIL